MAVCCHVFQVSCECDGAVGGARGHSVAVCQYSLSVKRPSVHVELVGTVSYQFPVGTPQSGQFSYKLPLSSFIR